MSLPHVLLRSINWYNPLGIYSGSSLFSYVYNPWLSGLLADRHTDASGMSICHSNAGGIRGLDGT